MMRIVVVLLLLPGAVTATAWQSLAEIKNVAEAFALAQHPSSGAGTTVQAGDLDPRLLLKDCDDRLVAFLPAGARPSVNMTVGVRCSGTTPWKVFIPVRSRSMGLVVVTRHVVPRGQVLTAADVTLAEHDLGRLPYGYLTDLAAIEGRVIRRHVSAGAVIIPPMLGQPKMVRRGQTVTLFTSGSAAQIQMSGVALMDGALQQRIRVENLSSGRVVEGVVRSAERVEVLLN